MIVVLLKYFCQPIERLLTSFHRRREVAVRRLELGAQHGRHVQPATRSRTDLSTLYRLSIALSFNLISYLWNVALAGFTLHIIGRRVAYARPGRPVRDPFHAERVGDGRRHRVRRLLGLHFYFHLRGRPILVRKALLLHFLVRSIVLFVFVRFSPLLLPFVQATRIDWAGPTALLCAPCEWLRQLLRHERSDRYLAAVLANVRLHRYFLSSLRDIGGRSSGGRRRLRASNSSGCKPLRKARRIRFGSTTFISTASA